MAGQVFNFLYNNFMDEGKNRWNESFIVGREYSPLNVVLIDLILESLSARPKTAVDFGCGTGDGAIKLATRGLQVVGFDFSEDALKKARLRAEEASVESLVEFKELDLNKVAFADLQAASVDLILCRLVIAFLKDQRSFCEYVRSVLSDTGTFILITPVLHEGYEYTPEDKPGIAVRHDETLALLRDVFSDVQTYNHSYSGQRVDAVTFLIKK